MEWPPQQFSQGVSLDVVFEAVRASYQFVAQDRPADFARVVTGIRPEDVAGAAPRERLRQPERCNGVLTGVEGWP